MLGVFVDESGTHGASARTVMAGCVANVEEWARLERRWSAILGAHGLRYVHAKELRQATGTFKNWNFDRRKILSEQLTSLLETGVKYSLVVVLNNRDFETFYRSHNKQDRKRQGPTYSIYGVCFRVFISVITGLVRQYDPGESFTITLEAGHKNSGAAEAIFAELKQDDPEFASAITGVAYVKKEEAFGVQAADLFAYVYFRGMDESPLVRKRIIQAAEPYVPALRPGVLSSFRVAITPETLKEIRSGQITRAQRRRWLRDLERD